MSDDNAAILRALTGVQTSSGGGLPNWNTRMMSFLLEATKAPASRKFSNTRLSRRLSGRLYIAPPAVLPGARITGAGSTAANGVYVKSATLWNGKNYYILVGKTDTGDPSHTASILWTASNLWEIVQDITGNIFYYSTDAVANPWQVTTWVLFTGVNPLPTVAIYP